MKNAAIILLTMVAIGLSSTVNAQTQKIGHIDIQYVLQSMPEFKQVQSEVQSLENELLAQGEAKQKEFEQKYQDYAQNAQNMSDLVRQDKEQELSQLQQSFQEFQQNAQASLQNKTQELMQPLYRKIGDSIEAVAKEQNFSHILNMGDPRIQDIVIYGQEQFDISNDVLKNMGITPPAN